MLVVELQMTVNRRKLVLPANVTTTVREAATRLADACCANITPKDVNAILANVDITATQHAELHSIVLLVRALALLIATWTKADK